MIGKGDGHDRLALLGALAQGLAHEIRNPLSTLEVNLQLLREDWAEAVTTKEKMSCKRVDLLLRETRRLEEILSDFLRFAETPEPHLKPCTLGPLLRDLVDFLEPELDTCGIRSVVDVPEDLPQVLADGALLKQALLNLAVNARQALASGGELRFRAEVAGDVVHLDVEDTGGEIPEEIRARIFDVYFSTRPRGTGLGLPISRRVVERHGGRLDLLRTSPEGTVFRMTLPRVPKNYPAAREET